jgi:hypothetical protein
MTELTKDQINVLEKIAKYEGSEWGDCVSRLLSSYHMRYYYSAEFREALCKELIDNYNYFTSNHKFEEVEITYTERGVEVVDKY